MRRGKNYKDKKNRRNADNLNHRKTVPIAKVAKVSAPVIVDLPVEQETALPAFQGLGVLTAKEIEEHNLIYPLEKKCLNSASYDLRLGSEVFECGKDNTNITVLGDSSFCVKIESFGTILFSTLEKVRVPQGIVGRFGLKIRYGLKGLILQVGPQVMPGYEGPLFGAILNTSGRPQELHYKDTLLNIEFSYTSPGLDPRFNNEVVSDLKEFLTSKRDVSLVDLSESNIVRSMEKRLQRCREDHGLMIKGQEHQSLMKGVKVALAGNRLMRWALLVAVGSLFISMYTLWNDRIPPTPPVIEQKKPQSKPDSALGKKMQTSAKQKDNDERTRQVPADRKSKS